MLYSSPWAGVEPTTSVVIDSGCIGSCKSNYHTITVTTAPWKISILYYDISSEQEVGLGQELKLKKGDKMRFTSDLSYKHCGTAEIMFIEIGEAIERVQVGNQVFIEDGPLNFKVVAKGIYSFFIL